MPYKFNKRGSRGRSWQNSSTKPQTAITDENYKKLMSRFVTFYQGINIVPDEEWDVFMKYLLTALPMSLRFSEKGCSISNVYDTKTGVAKEGEVLRDYFISNILSKVNGVKVGDREVELKSVPWFPNSMAWQANIEAKSISHNPALKSLKTFCEDEGNNFSVYMQDLTSMIPPLLTDIQPHHKILEMNADASGFYTALLLELLFSNAKQMPTGVVLSNGRFTYKVHRGNESTNVFYTRVDPIAQFKEYPDLYTTPEHTPGSKISYDRVFFKGFTSKDGLIRSNQKIAHEWNLNKAYKNHKLGIRKLRRGLELLSVGGQLIFYSHSMNPIENEAVVAALLQDGEGVLELVDVSDRVPGFHFRPGMTKWKVYHSKEFYETWEESSDAFKEVNAQSVFPPENIEQYNVDRCVRILPHDNDTVAMFIAVFLKTGDVKWTKEGADVKLDEVDVEIKEDVSEVDGSGDAKSDKEDGKKDDKKGDKQDVDEKGYKKPVKVVVAVGITEIEWTTDVTDDKLLTKTHVKSESYDLPPLKISQSCLPRGWYKPSDLGYKEMASNNEAWNAVKKQLDIRKFDPTRQCVEFSKSKYVNKTAYSYCSPLVKSLITCNLEEITRQSSYAGGLLLMEQEGSGKPEITSRGLLAILPHMNKRLLTVPASDIVLTLQNPRVIFGQFSPRTKALLQALDIGPVYFFYEPKVKTAEPKCIMYIRRERLEGYVNDAVTDVEENSHLLRICGIEPQPRVFVPAGANATANDVMNG